MKNRILGLCLVAMAALNTHPLAAAQDAHQDPASDSEHAAQQPSPDQHQPGADQHDEHEGESGHVEREGEGGHTAHEGEDTREEENSVQLTESQRRGAGIVVEAMSYQAVADEIEAPGEIRLNTYSTSRISPRIEAQVIERHARLADVVEKGKPMVTLSSVSMGEAQGALLVAANELQRVKKLGKKVVSDRRFVEAQIAFQQARAKLLAYGLTPRQADQLASGGKISLADGRFTLLAPQAGTVIRDDFIDGQMINPGDPLFEITDESTLWVEARVSPQSVSAIRVGASARIRADGTWTDGKVIQIHPALDEITRTQAVRLAVPNRERKLHPGQFVMVSMQSAESGEKAMTLPIDAVLRSPDGDWQVYVEKRPDEFEPKEVTLIRQQSGMAVIGGLEPGSRVVTRGAFFVHSELAKAGFAVHNH